MTTTHQDLLMPDFTIKLLFIYYTTNETFTNMCWDLNLDEKKKTSEFLLMATFQPERS